MSQYWVLINDRFLRLLINPGNFAVSFLRQKIWMKVSGPFPVCSKKQLCPCRVESWVCALALIKASTLVSIALVFTSFLTLTGFMKGTDEAFASSFHALWQCHCVSQCELVFPPLCPSDVSLSGCKGKGFILSIFCAYYCLSLGKLQRMSVYLIIQPDTLSFPDTLLFH